jgi:hypothetical protein
MRTHSVGQMQSALVSHQVVHTLVLVRGLVEITRVSDS